MSTVRELLQRISDSARGEFEEGSEQRERGGGSLSAEKWLATRVGDDFAGTTRSGVIKLLEAYASSRLAEVSAQYEGAKAINADLAIEIAKLKEEAADLMEKQ